MKWILLFGTWSAAQGQAAASAEFNDRPACDYAIEQLRKPPLHNHVDLMFAFCVPKDTPPGERGVKTWEKKLGE